MDKEQAIRILSAETSLEAIAELKQKANYDRGKVLYEIQTAMNMGAEALRKQIPKKPIYSDYDDNGFDEIIPYRAECPACGESLEFGKWNAEESHHCDCGQAISWED